MSAYLPSSVIRTPDQRVRVFISSTLQELAPERAAVKEAVNQLKLIPVMFELGARPHPPRDLYRAYLEQSHIFIGIYWQKYGWIAPDMEISGLEDEYLLSGNRPKLIYIKDPAPDREPQLSGLLDRIQTNDRVSYRPFSAPDELRELVENDLALLLTESFEAARRVTTPTEPRVEAREEPHAERPNNLPVLRGALIGREQELAAAQEMLLRADLGLLTLTGPGGTGKTRLALELASNLLAEFEDGVFFVPLAPITDPALVISTVAQTLVVREMSGRSLLDSLKDHLHDKHMLIVLDNFEQVADAAPVVAELLEGCPRLTILVTSRTPLRLRDEHELLVGPLEIPQKSDTGDLERLSHFAAVELFIQRALDVKPDFQVTNENAPAVAEICYRLDGLPLAIELAAARIKLLPPRAILDRLGSSLNLLTGGARDLPARQQTMRSAIEWSYDLLDEGEKTLFRRLSVFAGGCTIEAAEAVAGDPGPPELGLPDIDTLNGIDSLVNESLLRNEGSRQDEVGGEPRFSMLQTIREYASERLAEAGEAGALRRRHVEYYLELAEEAAPHFTTPQREQWRKRLNTELGNLRAATEWAMSSEGDIELAVRLAGTLSWFWYLSGYMTEGRKWLEAVISIPEAARYPRSYGAALFGAGWMAWSQTDYEAGRTRLEESVRVRREIDDKSGLSDSLVILGILTVNQGKPAEALPLFRESALLGKASGNKWTEVLALKGVGDALLMTGDTEGALATFEESLAAARRVGDTWNLAVLVSGIAGLAYSKGDYAQARDRWTESMDLFNQANDPWNVSHNLVSLGFTDLRFEKYEEARSRLRQGLTQSRRIGSKTSAIMSLIGFADLALVDGQPEKAARLLGAMDALTKAINLLLFPAERTAYDRSAAATREALGDRAFEAEWSSGRGMTLEQAAEYALGQE